MKRRSWLVVLTRILCSQLNRAVCFGIITMEMTKISLTSIPKRSLAGSGHTRLSIDTQKWTHHCLFYSVPTEFRRQTQALLEHLMMAGSWEQPCHLQSSQTMSQVYSQIKNTRNRAYLRLSYFWMVNGERWSLMTGWQCSKATCLSMQDHRKAVAGGCLSSRRHTPKWMLIMKIWIQLGLKTSRKLSVHWLACQ